MRLLIDANNLAGALGLLGQDSFDEKLIAVLSDYNRHRGNKISLVFDGVDYMGDKYSENNITVIYTPRDGYYESADEMIIELAERHFRESRDELKVITDDIELKTTLKERNISKGLKFKLVQASDFALLLQAKAQEVIDEDDRGLSQQEIDAVNDDLWQLWKQK